jgi:hypothetical protein
VEEEAVEGPNGWSQFRRYPGLDFNSEIRLVIHSDILIKGIKYLALISSTTSVYYLIGYGEDLTFAGRVRPGPFQVQDALVKESEGQIHIV